MQIKIKTERLNDKLLLGKSLITKSLVVYAESCYCDGVYIVFIDKVLLKKSVYT